VAGDRALLTKVGGVDISRDGRLLAMTVDKGVRVCTGSGETIADLAGHSKTVTAVAFSPDGRRIISGSEDGTARIWHVATGTEILSLKGYEGGVHDVCWSPDGRRLAAASMGKTVLVWQAFDWTIDTEQLSEEVRLRYQHWRKR
jgi:WD40 repeat protein